MWNPHVLEDYAKEEIFVRTGRVFHKHLQREFDAA